MRCADAARSAGDGGGAVRWLELALELEDGLSEQERHRAMARTDVQVRVALAELHEELGDAEGMAVVRDLYLAASAGAQALCIMQFKLSARLAIRAEEYS